jgi:hypothetical protein
VLAQGIEREVVPDSPAVADRRQRHALEQDQRVIAQTALRFTYGSSLLKQRLPVPRSSGYPAFTREQLEEL